MPAPHRDAVALVLGYSWLAISTPPLMTACYLADRGYEVDIFVDADPDFTGRLGINIPQLSHPGITIRATPPAPACPVRLACGESLPPEQCAFVNAYADPPRPYKWIIGFDAAGLCRAAALSERWKAPYVYHSLEFTLEDAPGKDLERRLNRHALYTLTQDALRAEALAALNHLDPATVHVARNSSMGPILPEKAAYFRNKFPIGDRTIVLAVGTLHPAHSIDKLLQSARSFPPEFVLVLHGWFNEAWFRAVAEAEMAANPAVFLSTDLLQPEEKFLVFQSADIGVVSFEPLDYNMVNGAASAGKLYDFMRCGVPMVGNDLPGMRALMEGDGFGLVVPDATRLHEALPDIMQDYAGFRQRALDAFPRYEFSASYDSILTMTLQMLAARSTP